MTPAALDSSRPTAPPADPLRLLTTLRRAVMRANGKLAELPTSTAGQISLLEQGLLEVLLSAPIPLPPPVRVLTRGMDDLYAQWFDFLARTEQPRAALAVLYQRLLLALASHGQLPATLWPQAVSLYRRSGDATAMGAILALGTLQAGSYTPRQLWALGQGLLTHGKKVEIRDKPPETPQGWLWLDSSGRPSGAARTLRTLSTDQLLYFSCAELARSLDEDAARVERGLILDWSPGLISNTELGSALRLAAGHWLAPLHRRHSRRRQSASMQVCVRLDQVWGALDSGNAPTETSDWLLLNASASGCALMHSSGEAGDLSAGQALGLQLPGKPWAVGVIRWIRSENSAHVELGIEILSGAAQPVRIAFERSSPEPAFLLPAITGQDMGEALLTTATASAAEAAKDFVLLAEKDGQLRISQCRYQSLRHKTSRIEVFTFERLKKD